MKFRSFAGFLAICAMGVSAAEAKQDATIHLISTTDLHGYLEAQKDKNGVATGGVDYASGYFNIAKKIDPETLLLDSGDMFQGTIISNDSEGAAVVKFYNYVGYTATAIGNHDFDFGPVGPDSTVHKPGEDPLGALKARISESKFSYLSANVCSVDEDPSQCTNATNYKVASFTRPYVIKSVHGINVAIIGLSTTATPSTTPVQNILPLRFFPMEQALERFVPEMKANGADVIVVIAHAGGFCKAGVCTPTDEIFSTIDKLSDVTRKSIGAVLAGHTHNYVNTVYNGVKVMIAGKYGQSFGYLTLDFHGADGTVTVRDAKSYDVCQKIYPDTKNCHQGTGTPVAPSFLGTPVTPDQGAADVIAKELAAADAIGKVVLGKALSPLTKGSPESTMGDFMADAARACYIDSSCQTHADIAFQNNGGIRSEIAAGPVDYNQIFQTMPFDNDVATIQMTGSQVRDLLDVWYAHELALPQMSGIQVTYDSTIKTTKNVTNSAGETRSFVDPIVSIESLDPVKTYTVVMSDFLALGGGGLDFYLRNFQPAPVINYDRKLRDTLVDFLKTTPAGVNYKGAAARILDKGTSHP